MVHLEALSLHLVLNMRYIQAIDGPSGIRSCRWYAVVQPTCRFTSETHVESQRVSTPHCHIP